MQTWCSGDDGVVGEEAHPGVAGVGRVEDDARRAVEVGEAHAVSAVAGEDGGGELLMGSARYARFVDAL